VPAGDHMVLGARADAVDRARSGVSPFQSPDVRAVDRASSMSGSPAPRSSARSADEAGRRPRFGPAGGASTSPRCSRSSRSARPRRSRSCAGRR
jgi:hypothetical protein